MDAHSQTKSLIQSLDPDEFEILVASVWSEIGWATEITQSSRDKGIDIIAEKSEIYDEKAIIQAKCYSSGNKVGRPEIQRYNSLKQQVSDADTVIVVTSSEFTSEAISLATQLNVKIIDGDELVQAFIQNISQDQKAHFFQNVPQVSQQEASFSENRVPLEDLTESEQDLSKIYKAYLSRIKKQQTGFRRLVFNVTRGEGADEDAYIVSGITHHIRVYPTDEELIRRIEVTANKYDWEIKEMNHNITKAISPNINHIHKAEFSIVIDATAHRDLVSAERQAKITNLLISSIYDQELSGTQVKEIAMGPADQAPTTRIE